MPNELPPKVASAIAPSASKAVPVAAPSVAISTAPPTAPSVAPPTTVAGSTPFQQSLVAKKAAKTAPQPKSNALTSMWGKTAKDKADNKPSDATPAVDLMLTDEVPEVAADPVATKRSKRAVRVTMRWRFIKYTPAFNASCLRLLSSVEIFISVLN